MLFFHFGIVRNGDLRVNVIRNGKSLRNNILLRDHTARTERTAICLMSTS